MLMVGFRVASDLCAMAIEAARAQSIEKSSGSGLAMHRHFSLDVPHWHDWSSLWASDRDMFAWHRTEAAKEMLSRNEHGQGSGASMRSLQQHGFRNTASRSWALGARKLDPTADRMVVRAFRNIAVGDFLGVLSGRVYYERLVGPMLARPQVPGNYLLNLEVLPCTLASSTWIANVHGEYRQFKQSTGLGFVLGSTRSPQLHLLACFTSKLHPYSNFIQATGVHFAAHWPSRHPRELRDRLHLDHFLYGNLHDDREPFTSYSTLVNTYNEEDREEILELVESELPEGFNQEQLALYRNSLAGVRGGAPLGYGMPGVGKTNVTVKAAYAKAKMGYKFQLTAHSGVAVDELYKRFVTLCEQRGDIEMRNRFVRINTVSQETAVDQRMQHHGSSSRTGESLHEPALRELWDADVAEKTDEPLSELMFASVTTRCHALALEPAMAANEWVRKYRKHQQLERYGSKKPKGLEPYQQVMQELFRLVLEQTLVVGVTTSRSDSLFVKFQFKANALYLDEGSQCSVPSAVIPLANQRQLRLVVILYDNKQLPSKDPAMEAKATPLGPLAHG